MLVFDKLFFGGGMKKMFQRFALYLFLRIQIQKYLEEANLLFEQKSEEVKDRILADMSVLYHEQELLVLKEVREVHEVILAELERKNQNLLRWGEQKLRSL